MLWKRIGSGDTDPGNFTVRQNWCESFVSFTLRLPYAFYRLDRRRCRSPMLFKAVAQRWVFSLHENTYVVTDIYYLFKAGASGRAVKSVGLRPCSYWDCGFESRGRHGCLSLLSVVCCQVEISASGWSLIQRNSTEGRVSEYDREAVDHQGLLRREDNKLWHLNIM